MTNQPADARSAYFPALDGLRTVCCVWVVFGHGFVFHPWQEFASRMSGMGVHVFFALSGFLITTLLLRELSSRRRVDLTAFYTRRALRIFPVYYAALFVALSAFVVLGDRFARPLGTSMAQLDLRQIAISHILFLANWVSIPVPGALDVLWSISVEEQFYLLFPITFARSSRRHPVLLPIAVGMVLALAVRAYVCRIDPQEIYRNTFATGDHLLLGALAAQFVHSNRGAAVAIAKRVGTAGEVLVFGAVVLICLWKRQQAWEFYVEASLSALVSAAIVLLVGVGNGAITRFLAVPTMRKLGQLTYAAYVFHMYGVIAAWAIFNRIGFGIRLAAPLRTALATVFAFAIGYAVRMTFEGRVLALKRRFERA